MRLLVCLAVLAACEKPEDIVKEFRPKAEAKLEQMRVAVKNAVEKPASGAPVLPVKLVFAGRGTNAFAVHSEWFDKDPTKRPEKQIVLFIGTLETIRGYLLGRSPSGHNTGTLRTSFEEFMGVRFLVEVQTTWFSTGSISAERTDGVATFSGGSYKGTLNFIDIEKGASLGTIEVESGHSEKVDIIKGNEEEHLSSDIWLNATKAIEKALEPYKANPKAQALS